MTELLVEAAGVSVRRNDALVLDGVDLAAAAGEVVAVVGPNGSGKSTLMAVLAGDEEPTAGEARLAGRPVRSWRGPERARRRAVLTQDASVAFGFRVRDVVAMGRTPWWGQPEAADDERVVGEAMDATEVAGLADRGAASLSGGELARVVLARTLAQRAPVLLLDEPTASLDLRHAVLVLEQARRHADAGGAVVIVLHDLSAAARAADRLVLLHGGCVAASGTPAEVLRAEVLSAVYAMPIEVRTDAGAPIVSPGPASGRVGPG